ncbi:MAG: serine hydrolase domain-containing protein [Bacteroidia bacterium]|nr:serine hydrolase domain-containing protein [Bacteroidia bacterium]
MQTASLTFDLIRPFLDRMIQSGETPGLHYACFSGSQILYQYSAGMACLRSGDPMEPRHTLHWYSITKTFTALAVLRLADQGLLDLDGLAASYLPDFPYPGPVTLRQLLTHRAGIPNPFPLNWIHPAAEHARFDPDAFFAEVFRRHSRLHARPGTRYAYSNLGYVLLGQILESVTRQPLETVIEQQVLRPARLGPGSAGFAAPDISRHACGYHRRNTLSYHLLGLLMRRSEVMDPQADGRWRAFRPAYVNGAAYGGLIGTAEALARYGQALLQPSLAWLPPASRRVLLGLDGQPALAWFSGQLRQQPYRAHAGGGGGYYGEIRLYPEAGIGTVILLNRSGLSDARLLDGPDLLTGIAGAPQPV